MPRESVVMPDASQTKSSHIYLGLVGSSVKVTLEIEADVSGGVPEIVRTVTENSRTLKFNSYGFEQE
jgi:hypothetical protein